MLARWSTPMIVSRVLALTVLGACASAEPLETEEVSESALVAGAPAAPAVAPVEARASRGVLGGYEHGRVWGWAQLLDDDTPVHVRIDVDGEPVATWIADEPRRDLVDKRLHPTGRAGFSGVIDDLPRGAAVEAIIVETGALLTNGPCVVQGYGPVSSCTEGLSRGALHYQDGWAHGWAQIIGRDAPVTVVLQVDGEPVARILADRARPDLVEKRLHPTGTAGFEVEIGPLPAASVIEAFVEETEEPLNRKGVPRRALP